MKSFVCVGRWYSWSPQEWLLFCVLSLMVWGPLLGPAAALSAPSGGVAGKLTWQAGQLTARLGATPLAQVMQEVGRVSGAQVVWLQGVESELPVSVEFPALPVAEALRRILKGKNFLLFYAATAKGMRLRQIWISSPGNGQLGRPFPPVAPVTPAPEDEEGDVDKQEQEEQQRWASLPITTLLDTAEHDQDPAERIEAITSLEGRAHEDQRVVEILAHIAQNDPHPQVQDMAAQVLQHLE